MSPVTSYGELMTKQALAAVRVTGAHHSSWNGKVEPLPPEDAGHRGLAKWDGRVQYSDRLVTYPLQEMFRHRGRTQSARTLESYRDALKVVYHENIHMLAAVGTSHGLGSEAYQHPAGAAIEEGVTEAYTHATLNDYIEELGLEQVAPGISSVREPVAYPHYVAAAGKFADAIGRRGGLDGTEVLRRMAVVNTAEKFQVAAELLYSASDLPGRVPESERAAAVERIESAMKAPFEHIHDYDANDPADLKMAALAGVTAERAGYQEVRSLQQQWASPAPGTDLGPEQARLDHDPRGPDSGQPGQGRPGGEPGQLDQPDQPGEGRPSRAEPAGQAGGGELGEAARIGLGGTAPIQRPQRLASEQFGSRRQAGQQGQTHQPHKLERGD